MSWWLALTRNSSFMINNCNGQSLSHQTFKRLPKPFWLRIWLAESDIVAQPRTSKGITDLLLPSWLWLNSSSPSKKVSRNLRVVLLFIWLTSCSLTELTWQITPPTRNGHAPPPIESRKSSHTVSPYYVRNWWVSMCWVKLSHRLHSWRCPSISFFSNQVIYNYFFLRWCDDLSCHRWLAISHLVMIIIIHVSMSRCLTSSQCRFLFKVIVSEMVVEYIYATFFYHHL